MAVTTFDALRNELNATPSGVSPEYVAKQLHPIPTAEVFDRVVFLVGACKDEVVLHIGASGQAHQGLKKVAKKVYGLDLHPDSSDVVTFDCDALDVPLPQYPDVTRILCGEVLEHLTNPGHLLRRVRATYPSIHVIITVPNAYHTGGYRWVQQKHTENVNRDHTAWYSYRTLKTLIEKCGYVEHFFAWYGPPQSKKTEAALSEGLIFVAKSP
jgi:2-polyprenyl-3-methyl-5-hydroxy-6-metoxy-1,4-benzoquinol methylase